MTQAVILAAIALLASKLVEFAKYVRNGDVNGAVTLFIVWIVGVIVIFLASAAVVTQDLILPGLSQPLVDMDFWSKVFLGMIATSFISFGYDVKKAVDGTDSAATPPLVK